ncbi:MAG: hypothetical protein RBT34_13775 [Anaerolineaceae bacterium]|nr:hypothetical protein [Anaerolineaceae bacterium]
MFTHKVSTLGQFPARALPYFCLIASICKSCSKAVCHECAVDVGKGIACKGSCEEDVQMINSIVDRNTKAYSTLKSRSLFGPIFLIITGMVFVGYGLTSAYASGLSVILGICFVLYGVVAIIANKRYIGKLNTENKQADR